MTKKILLVEDNSQTQNILELRLKKCGYQVTTENIGKNVINKAKTILPDLIILDILLEGEINGINVLEQIKNQKILNTTPVIILTNLDNKKDEAHKLGVNDYLIKANISLNDIMDKVKHSLK